MNERGKERLVGWGCMGLIVFGEIILAGAIPWCGGPLLALTVGLIWFKGGMERNSRAGEKMK
ncbi:MAG: hypothetical protein AAB697_03435 [Patescibacteria group bacterium]|mgnify:FL=1